MGHKVAICCLIATVFGRRVEETGCWDSRNIGGGTNTLYNPVGKATRLLPAAQDHRKQLAADHPLHNNAEEQFCCSELPIVALPDGKVPQTTACHHPLLCEISSCHKKNPSHTCVRPTHLLMGSGLGSGLNGHHLAIQRFGRKQNLTEKSTMK